MNKEARTINFRFTISIVLLDDFQSVLSNVQTDTKLYWFCECLELFVQNTESQLGRDLSGRRGRLVLHFDIDMTG